VFVRVGYIKEEEEGKERKGDIEGIEEEAYRI
jgi:hypothetical protein